MGSSVIDYPEVLCYESPQFFMMLPIAFIGILLYTVLPFSVMVYATYCAPERIIDKRWSMRYRFLYIGSQPRACWWSIVSLLLGIVYNFIPVFTDVGFLQLIVLIIATVVIVCLSFYWAPLIHLSSNIIAMALHLCFLMVLVVGMSQVRRSPVQELLEKKLGFLISVLICLSFIPPAVVCAMSLYRSYLAPVHSES